MTMSTSRHQLFDSWVIPTEDIETTSTTLGKGVFGEVRLGKWNGTEVAVKFPSRDASTDSKYDLKKEIEIMRELHHPNVVQFLGYSVENEFAIVMEYLPGGSLESYILEPHRTASFVQRLNWCSDMAQAVAYLHNRKPHFLIHRDVKPANFVLTRSLQCKLVDFGLGRFFESAEAEPVGEPPYLPLVEWKDGDSPDPGGMETWMEQTSNIGTVRYMAPEVRRQRSGGGGDPSDKKRRAMKNGLARFSTPADVFSLGMSFYFVMEGGVFPKVEGGNNPESHFTSLASGNRPLYKNTAPPTRRLIDLMLLQIPCRRPTCREVVVILRESLNAAEAATTKPPFALSIARRRASARVLPLLPYMFRRDSTVCVAPGNRENSEVVEAVYTDIKQRGNNSNRMIRFGRFATSPSLGS